MFLGVDIGGTSVKAGILTNDNKLIEKKSIPTNSHDGVKILLPRIKAFVCEYFEHYPNIKSIGFGVPGVVDSKGCIAVAPNLDGWIDIPFARYINTFANVPFAVDNDANAAALSELHLGSVSNKEHFIYLTLGTGVGGAIIADRQIFRGSSGGAGEIGHTIISYDAKQKKEMSYQTGTLEAFLGRNSILELAKKELRKFPQSSLKQIKKYDVADIQKAADEGDELASKVLEQCGVFLGIGIASAMNLLDIPTAVIGGGIGKSSILVKSAKANAINRVLPSLIKPFEILNAKFDSDTGVIGAALLGKGQLEEEF